MVVEKRLFTIDEFEAFTALPENHDRNFELINGEIIEKAMPTELHGIIAGNTYGPLWNYTRETKRGRVVFEVRYRLPGDEHNARQPDISYWLLLRTSASLGIARTGT